jgi:hypothetical protein
MNTSNLRMKWLVPVLACAAAAIGQGAALLTNGDFESGFTGWTRLDQTGSEGTFALQTGTESPVNMFPVPAPPGGTSAAMTDASGPGSHVLYQDFLVPMDIPTAMLSFSLYINNGAPDFYVAGHLDFATPDLNQQARVDIITTSADPFSVIPSDILLNLYQSQPGAPLVSGYANRMMGLTAFLRAHQGETLRLRFAQVDNVLNFNMGIDNVGIAVNPIPEPSTWFTTVGALLGAVYALRRNRA